MKKGSPYVVEEKSGQSEKPNRWEPSLQVRQSPTALDSPQHSGSFALLKCGLLSENLYFPTQSFRYNSVKIGD
ncbi:hypothetical protein [Nostoc sp.]|uniref:hypothetical protein n=1 Tax=Nostoc sp. TaxID=1180 RepID=UPI002FF7AA3B